MLKALDDTYFYKRVDKDCYRIVFVSLLGSGTDLHTNKEWFSFKKVELLYITGNVPKITVSGESDPSYLIDVYDKIDEIQFYSYLENMFVDFLSSKNTFF